MTYPTLALSVPTLTVEPPAWWPVVKPWAIGAAGAVVGAVIASAFADAESAIQTRAAEMRAETASLNARVRAHQRATAQGPRMVRPTVGGDGVF